MTKRKRAWLGLAGLLLTIVVGMAICDVLTVSTASGRLYDRVGDIPARRVGLLLGTAPKHENGGTNLYFVYRVDAAAELYKAGKVDRIIVSGDNHVREYSEPDEMRDSLLARGIPDSVLVLDYAGLRTLDSVVRAQKIFGQSQLIVISQRFHNERALCLAHHFGIDAIGFNAKDLPLYYQAKGFLRERLARVKMFLDFLTGKQPKHLGNPIEIQ